MRSTDKGRQPPHAGVGNTPTMWRQTIYFLVIPLAALLVLRWFLAD